MKANQAIGIDLYMVTWLKRAFTCDCAEIDVSNLLILRVPIGLLEEPNWQKILY